MKPFRTGRRLFLSIAALTTLLAGATSALLGTCGPFTDVSDVNFCPFVLEIFTLGITTGTTPTTYDPASNVSRLQMAAFLSRSVDGVLKRGSRRAALDRFWIPQNASALDVTTVQPIPLYPRTDGFDVWVPSFVSNTVARVRVNDGKLLDTWTGASSASVALLAIGKIFVTGNTLPGNLYRIDPRQPAGAVTVVASNLGSFPYGIAFDGAKIWTANQGAPAGSVSIVTPGSVIPWTVTTVTAGFNSPNSTIFDGANVWVTDNLAGTLLRLNASGGVLQTITVGSAPLHPVFDGANIWVPTGVPSVAVVRASNGAVLATLTGNGLNSPFEAAFDGERVLVTNFDGDGVSLWKAADLTTIGFVSTGSGSKPKGVCSDGVNFWVVLQGLSQLARF